MPDLRSIEEMQKKGFGEMYREKFKEAFTHDWYFSGWEKALIVACFLWTAFSVVKFIWGIL